jgi:hypothetical protein
VKCQVIVPSSQFPVKNDELEEQSCAFQWESGNNLDFHVFAILNLEVIGRELKIICKNYFVLYFSAVK